MYDIDFFKLVDVVYKPDVHIESIKVDFAKQIYFEHAQSLSKDAIFLYCVERCLQHGGINDIDYWNLSIREFYYGAEVTEVKFKKHDSIVEDIEQLSHLNQTDMVEYALTKEYGYLLDCVKNKKWSLQNIPNDKIVGNPKQQEELNEKLINKYKDYSGPRCILIPNNDHFRLIDGYHRHSAARDDSKILSLVAE